MRGEVEEVLCDPRRPPHFAVQHHQRPGALGVERAAVQQVRERSDCGEAVVQRIQHVRGTFVEHDVLYFGRGEARGRDRRGEERRGGPPPPRPPPPPPPPR